MSAGRHAPSIADIEPEFHVQPVPSAALAASGAQGERRVSLSVSGPGAAGREVPIGKAKVFFLGWAAGIASVFFFGFFLIRQDKSRVRASSDYGRFSAVKQGMAPAEVIAALGRPSCVQSALQLEKNEGPVCVPYQEQPPAGLVMVYLQGDFMGRVRFGGSGKAAELEAFVPPRSKVVPAP